MIRFESDYLEGAHPLILKRMEETNFEQTAGYGNDPFCDSARQKIKKLCGSADVDVHFLVGGTQTNFTVISAILRPYQGAVAASTGHINVHETGAVEATGHKVLALPSEDGKIMRIMSISCSRGLSISPSRRRTEPSTAGKNCRPCMIPAPS